MVQPPARGDRPRRDYSVFLRAKQKSALSCGIKPKTLVASAEMRDFQRDIVRWALRMGRAAVFAGTGLGKTIMALSWAGTLVRERGVRALILTPLAVAQQFKREGRKFGVDVQVCAGQTDVTRGINVTNYEKLHKFDLSEFGAVVLDESSILKSYDGKTRTHIIQACARVPYRLACTATPSPNDFMELGNHAEFVGAASYTDMLSTFFTHDGGDTSKWRLRGHAENEFWRWVSTWAVMFQHPRDLGYSGVDDFNLPELRERYHVVKTPAVNGAGTFLADVAVDLRGRIAARRASVGERVRAAVDLTPKAGEPFVWWCSLNAESAALAAAIDGAVELSGSDSENVKIKKLNDFASGRVRVLVTKPSICGHGLNWQHCHMTGFVGLTDSFEQVYQAVRRFWRFGQKHPVDVQYVTADSEGAVLANIRRKHEDGEKMRAGMLRNMVSLNSAHLRETDLAFSSPVSVPPILPVWL